jgi:integrase
MTTSLKVAFVGERGPLTDNGVQAVCDQYAAIIGVKLTIHLFRHTTSCQFLSDDQNDHISLSQIVRHESLNTTARYTPRTEDALASVSEKLIA